MQNNTTIGQDLQIIQEKGIAPLMNFLTNAAQSGNTEAMTPMQKRLYERKYGSAPKPDKITPLKKESKQTTQKADVIPNGSVTRVGGQEYKMGDPADVKALGAVLAADQASRPNQQFADLRGGGGMTSSTGMQPRVKQTDDMDENMKIWAKANPKLAAKVKAGQSGYGAIQDALGLSTKDERDAASDLMVMGTNPDEAMARAKGGIVEVDIDGSGVGPAKIDPQGFKDSKMMSLISTLNNPAVTPIVEDMELPDTSKYAGIFNQTNAPDYKTMMENAAMGQLAENLGLSTKGYDTSNYFDRMFGK
jgi:hypothetical protein